MAGSAHKNLGAVIAANNDDPVARHDTPVFARDIHDAQFREECRQLFQSAAPFPHIVIDGLFDVGFLRKVSAEFDDAFKASREIQTSRQHTFRSNDPKTFGRETTAYFDTMHRNAVVEFISAITGVENLITDHTLRGGGLHESRDGGWFDIHLDFNQHRQTMLDNELVAITYLNEDWQDTYGGDLELWSKDKLSIERSIAPIMSRTVIMKQTPASYHGHTTPLNTGGKTCRRSLAVYYYSNRAATSRTATYRNSLFALNKKGKFAPSDALTTFADMKPMQKVRHLARNFTPPVVWKLLSTH